MEDLCLNILHEAQLFRSKLDAMNLDQLFREREKFIRQAPVQAPEQPIVEQPVEPPAPALVATNQSAAECEAARTEALSLLAQVDQLRKERHEREKLEEELIYFTKGLELLQQRRQPLNSHEQDLIRRHTHTLIQKSRQLYSLQDEEDEIPSPLLRNKKRRNLK
jgi:hypothetical protein